MILTKPAAIILFAFAVIGMAGSIVAFVNVACRLAGLNR